MLTLVNIFKECRLVIKLSVKICKKLKFNIDNNVLLFLLTGSEMQFIYALDDELRFVTKSHSNIGVVHSSAQPNFHVSGLDVDSHKRCVYWSSSA